MLSLYLLMLDTPDEHEKFKSIYKKYEVLIYNVALKVTNEHYMAIDATQNSFISIARNINTIKTDNEIMLKSYIYTIAENAAIDLLRKKKRDERLEISNDCLDIPDDCNIHNEIETKDCVTKLVKLIKNMPKTYREVLVLKLLLNRSTKEIASILNIQYESARKRLFRAKKELKQMIQEVSR